jgi:hypothetical protein
MTDCKMWEILVPCKWNDDKPVRTRHHKEWDKRVRKITGGLTILPPTKGIWVNEGKIYEERMIPVRIACTDKQINEIMDMTAQHYKQLAVLCTLISENVLIKHYKV